MSKTYTTIAGDMWDMVAYKAFGDESYTDKIMLVNPGYRHLVIFPAGITLTLPEKAQRTSSSLPPWKRGV